MFSNDTLKAGNGQLLISFSSIAAVCSLFGMNCSLLAIIFIADDYYLQRVADRHLYYKWNIQQQSHIIIMGWRFDRLP